MHARYANQSPSASTFLLPVCDDAYRKLNGHCASSASDGDAVETSFVTKDDEKVGGDCLGLVINGLLFNQAGVHNIFRVGDVIERPMSPRSQMCEEVDAVIPGSFYLDTKGVERDVPIGNQHDACCAAGSRPSTSLLTTGSSSTYARVAGDWAVSQQVGRDYVISGPSSSVSQRNSAGKYVYVFAVIRMFSGLCEYCDDELK